MLRTRNNTDRNKLVIFSGIALYYGDTCIVLQHEQVGVLSRERKAPFAKKGDWLSFEGGPFLGDYSNNWANVSKPHTSELN